MKPIGACTIGCSIPSNSVIRVCTRATLYR
jgi:hypothetical protein